MPITVYKKTTPGRRQMSVLTYEELTTDTPFKKLTERIKKHAGRNSRGIITCRHHGGGAARQYRLVDFKQKDNHHIPGTVKSVEYDPNRSAFVMLVYYKNGDKRYLLAPEGIKVGQSIMAAPKTKVKSGNRLQLQHIPVGFSIYNVEMSPHRGGQIIRSAGSSGKIIGFDGNFAQIELPSHEVRMVPKECFASIGRVSNLDYNLVSIGKAGRNRHRGHRPEVRGKVMNPCDHPHGGGEGKNPIGLKFAKTPWGKHAMGKLTRERKKASNRLIIRTRRGKMLKVMGV
jgi:large subunit ribosomal protein L2